jgi:hypothetical protein
MAGLKKSKKDGSSPNIVLVCFLIFFVLLSIGLGVFAYYGYDGQDKLKQEAKTARKQVDDFKADRDQWRFGFYEASGPVGITALSTEARTDYDSAYKTFVGQPEKFNDVAAPVRELRKKNADLLGTFSEAELKYPTTYSEKLKAAIDDAAASKSELAAKKKEFDDFKKNYDDFVANYQTQLTKLQEEIKTNGEAALKKSGEVNDKFPALDNLLKKEREDKLKLQAIDDDIKKNLESDLGRANTKIRELENRIADRTLGLAIGGGGTGDTMLHALMLDISKGLPLWDRPLGKVIRIDPSNLTVYIDIGSARRVVPEMTFQVFAGSPQGRADRQLKGTIEVIRVLDENSSLCRITSMFNTRGETIPLGTPEARMSALRDTDSMFREGDLLFNTFFDSHIVIAGNIGFNRIGTESPSTQMMQLQEFTQILRKQHIYVDAYVNLINGQFEGTLTPRTRLLVRGDFTPLSSEDQNRVKLIKEAYTELEKQAIANGMFVISAENFAAVIGYRPPQSQLAKESPIGFRPLLPFVNSNDPRGRPGGAGVSAPPMPMGEMPAPAAKEKAE